MKRVLDNRSRPLRDLRISVTDRCNFRCTYCMPKEIYGRDFAFLPRAQLLTFEEITRLARTFAREGASKIRLTGGEPLLRRDLEQLVAMLADIDEITDIALTTNGSALAAKAHALKTAGLTRVTVSLDALDDDTFAAMNDVAFPVARVLAGIAAAAAARLTPVKTNMVVKRAVNDDRRPRLPHTAAKALHRRSSSFQTGRNRPTDPVDPGLAGSRRSRPPAPSATGLREGPRSSSSSRRRPARRPSRGHRRARSERRRRDQKRGQPRASRSPSSSPRATPAVDVRDVERPTVAVLRQELVLNLEQCHRHRRMNVGVDQRHVRTRLVVGMAADLAPEQAGHRPEEMVGKCSSTRSRTVRSTASSSNARPKLTTRRTPCSSRRPERDLAVIVAVTHRGPLMVPLALRADDLVDLLLQHLAQHTQPNPGRSREQPLLRCPDQLTKRFLDALEDHAVIVRGLCDRYGVLHGGSSFDLCRIAHHAPTRSGRAEGPPSAQLLHTPGQPTIVRCLVLRMHPSTRG
jgi:pyruvate-formate lyase-activating enzyme